MEKSVQELVNDMNGMVTIGQLTAAGEKYYAPSIRTIEFDGRVTGGKQAAMKKLTDFVESIQNVKGITLLVSASDGNASFSEFILDLEMKDGTTIYLHEIVRAIWENGLVVEERYFKG